MVIDFISEETSSASPALGSSAEAEDTGVAADAGIAIGLTVATPPTADVARCWEARASAAVAAGSGATGASASATCVSSVWIAGSTAPAATAATRIEPVVEDDRVEEDRLEEVRVEDDRVRRAPVRVPLRENGTVSGSPIPCRLTVTSRVVGRTVGGTRGSDAVTVP
jgi:hypothetical protein